MVPDSLTKLINSFKLLPGIGEKTAERLAYAVLNLEKDQVDYFAKSLNDSFSLIHRCPICNSLTDLEICSICSLDDRGNTLMIVDDPKNIFLFEKLGMFNGKYHVLNGLINPLEGVNPEDVGLDKLIERINKEKFKEIIFALKPSIEGETTTLYIKKILEGMDITISKLASGLPIGADFDYIDKLTLELALSDRKVI